MYILAVALLRFKKQGATRYVGCALSCLPHKSLGENWETRDKRQASVSGLDEQQHYTASLTSFGCPQQWAKKRVVEEIQATRAGIVRRIKIITVRSLCFFEIQNLRGHHGTGPCVPSLSPEHGRPLGRTWMNDSA